MSQSSGGELPVFSEDSSSQAPRNKAHEVKSGDTRDDETPSDEERRENGDVLNQLEACLRKPDAVMEPDILTTLGDYIRENGNPTQAIEYLTDGYVGYAQMGSLLCSWLRFLEEEEEEDSGTGVGETMNTPAESSPSTDLKERIPDEATFLRQLALEKFKPAIFSGIFSSGGSGAPKWLNSLIEDAEGRQLIYDLSHRHSNCLLLTFAIQKIVMQPGRDEEVASEGVDLSNYFSVFHRILMVRLRALASTNDEMEIQKLVGLIQQSALASLLGYVHVRQILTQLASSPHPWSSRFRRLCQDLEIASKDGIACKMSRFFSPDDDISFVASSLIADILATASGGHIAPTSDVIKLFKIYSAREGTLPSVTLLHHPMIIEVLLKSLFNPSKRLHGEALEAHVFVMSISVCGLDSAQTLREQDDVARMIHAMTKAVSLGHQATEDVVLSPGEKEQARSSMEFKCCAAGILILLRKKLISSEYWSSTYHVHKEPPFLSLLFAINEKQPMMQPEVFVLIKDALQTAGHASQNIDVLVGLVNVLVDLCKTNLIDTILPWAVQWSRNASSEISREFIYGILAIAAPPYSNTFAEYMIQIMTVSNIRRQTMGSRLWNAKLPLTKEFLATIESMQVPLSLGAPEKAYIRDLKLSIPS